MFEVAIAFLLTSGPWWGFSIGLVAIFIYGTYLLERREITSRLEAEFNQFLYYEPFDTWPVPAEG